VRKWILLAFAGLVVGCAQTPRDDSEARAPLAPPEAVSAADAERGNVERTVESAVDDAPDALPAQSAAADGGDDWGESAPAADDDWGDGGDDWAGSGSGDLDDPFAGPAMDWEEIDPWEGFNRKMFGFNEFVDRYALKPAAKGYRFITPQWLDDTFTRFFANLQDFRSGLNNVLQWRWGQARDNFGRFSVNTTLGLAGLFDVASELDIPKHKTDLGLTLARWGVDSGPYLVLPLFGPSTVRDAATIWPEDYMRLSHYLLEDTTDRLIFSAVYAVDLRADLLDLERNIIGDRYTFLRNFYITQRMKGEGLSRVPGPAPKAEGQAAPAEEQGTESEPQW
jgi:phospholipid-binding lipoprotein MlaA|tara:strand:+ start:2551 stop:3561 length:1011 start_codon:yes stop_codon:yes gene_type:complete